jgi:hypothetical protein
MPLAPVDDHDTHFYYEDTGPLDDPLYVTLVIVHGTAFHGGTQYYLTTN